jgi:hypothetical protein
MNEIIESIRIGFASVDDGKMRPIEGLDPSYPAYVIRMGQEFGVCFEAGDMDPFTELFANTRVTTSRFTFGGKTSTYLLLLSKLSGTRREFAHVAANFVDPGHEGARRKQFISNPEVWTSSWKDLLGNASVSKAEYDVLGELIVLHHYFATDKTIKWTGSHEGTHDLESEKASFEVKSTLSKYANALTISSQNQLESDKSIYLVFIRLEKNPHGESINDYVRKLVQAGFSEEELEEGLGKGGFVKGLPARNHKYIILESRVFTVDDNFPRLNMEELKDPELRERIIKISYTVDVTGLDYETF